MDEFASKLKLLHPLSCIDQSVSRKYVRRMFIFDFPVVTKATVEEATLSLYRGLEVAFTHYPFLTGMLGPADAPGRDLVELRYGDKDELREIRDEMFRVKVHHGDPVVGHGYEELCRVEDGTTEGAKGGALILCLEFQHSIADGTSIGLFVDVFAAGIRGDATSESVGEYTGMSVNRLFEEDLKKRQAGLKLEKFREWDFDDTKASPRKECNSHIMTISAKMIIEIKRRMTDHLPSQAGWISSTDCLCALLWFYITRARRSSFTSDVAYDTLFATAVNARHRLKNIDSSYFGNMFTTVATIAKSEWIIPDVDDIKDLAYLPPKIAALSAMAYRIRGNLEEVSPGSILDRLTVLSMLDSPTQASVAAQRASQPTVSGFKFGSLVSFGADVNFAIPGTAGEGCPRWCRKPWMNDEGMVNILPRKGGTKGNSDWEILLCLPQKIIDFMLSPDEFGQFADRYVHGKEPSKFLRRKALLPGRRRINIHGTNSALSF